MDGCRSATSSVRRVHRGGRRGGPHPWESCAVAYENAQLYVDLRRHVAALEQEVADRRRAEHALRLRARLAMFSSAVGTSRPASATVSVMLQACADAAVQHVDAVLAGLWIVGDPGDVRLPLTSVF